MKSKKIDKKSINYNNNLNNNNNGNFKTNNLEEILKIELDKFRIGELNVEDFKMMLQKVDN